MVLATILLFWVTVGSVMETYCCCSLCLGFPSWNAGSSKLSEHADFTLIATAFATAAGLAISYASGGSLAWLVVGMLLLGFGFSVFFPFMLNLILNRSRRGAVGALIGAYEAIFGIGWAAGPLMAGWIYIRVLWGRSNIHYIFSNWCGVWILALIRCKSLTSAQCE